MTTISGSAQEIADKMGVDYGMALAVLITGTRPNPTGRGKGATIYQAPIGPFSLQLLPTSCSLFVASKMSGVALPPRLPVL